jgi:hypothetical protein
MRHLVTQNVVVYPTAPMAAQAACGSVGSMLGTIAPPPPT